MSVETRQTKYLHQYMFYCINCEFISSDINEMALHGNDSLDHRNFRLVFNKGKYELLDKYKELISHS